MNGWVNEQINPEIKVMIAPSQRFYSPEHVKMHFLNYELICYLDLHNYNPCTTLLEQLRTKLAVSLKFLIPYSIEPNP